MFKTKSILRELSSAHTAIIYQKMMEQSRFITVVIGIAGTRLDDNLKVERWHIKPIVLKWFIVVPRFKLVVYELRFWKMNCLDIHMYMYYMLRHQNALHRFEVQHTCIFLSIFYVMSLALT